MNDKITKTSLGKGGKGQTDWKRVDALTDEEIAQAIAEDPDTFEPDPEWLQRAMILRPGQPKIRVTAYFDQEVVEWFRAQGRGYQTRMNAVLRAYMCIFRGCLPPNPWESCHSIHVKPSTEST